MSNDITNNMNNEKKSIAYGAKLKAAREAMGLEQKDVAAQLRLAERIIIMLESGHYAEDVPTTFVRGYLRSYSKLLQIPASDITAALEPIKPAPAPQDAPSAIKQPSDLTSSNYYMQFSTYAIVATLAGMLGLWWYNHTPASNAIAPSQTLVINDIQSTPTNQPVVATTVRIPLAPISNTSTAAPAIGPTLASASTTSPNGTITATPSENHASTPTTATKPSAATKRVTRDEDDDEDDDDERDND